METQGEKHTMSPKLKIYAGAVALIVFIGVTNYIFSSNFMFLFISLLAVMMLFYFVHRLMHFVRLVKFWFKFAVLLVCVFMVMGLVTNGFNLLVLKESLMNGILTILILLNTVFAVELFILSVTVNDILAVNIPIQYLKFFILMRTLAVRGIAKFDNEKIIFNIIPEFKRNKKINLSNIKSVFMQNLVLIITIAFYIIEQGKILGPLIDNRIKHCSK